VTYSVNPKTSKETKTFSTNQQPLYHYIIPPQSYPHAFIHYEPRSTTVHAQSQSCNSVSNPSVPQVEQFLPVNHRNAAIASPKVHKNTGIIRVPRDNKTPFVVFKPEMYPSNFIATRPPYLPPPQPVKVPIMLPKNLLQVQLPLVTSSTSTKDNVVCSVPSLSSYRGIITSPQNSRSSVFKSQEESKHSIKVLIHNDNSTSGKQKCTTFLLPKESTPTTSSCTGSVVKSEFRSKYPKMITSWSIDDVYSYLKETDCAENADIFKKQEIDGKTLLLLDEISISRLLDIKMGPAIKLTALIKSLINNTA